MFVVATGSTLEEQLQTRTALYQPPLEELKTSSRPGGAIVRKAPRRALSVEAARKMMENAEEYDRKIVRGR